MSEYTVLPEWLDQNAHRQFPLDDAASGIDSTGYFSLPQSLLVDIFICAPLSANPDKFFLSQVVVRTRFIDLTFSYVKPDATIIKVATVSSIPADAGRNSTFTLEPVQHTLADERPFNLLTGVVVIGSCEPSIQYPGQWSFSYTTGKIISARVSLGLSVVQSISDGSDIFSGNIVLKEGTNVRLTPSYDPGTDTTTITISANLGSTDALADPLVDDQSLLRNLISTYGRPIATINGISSDSNFNFQIVPQDCTQVNTPAPFGIAISNPCSKPCCDKSMLDTAYTTLSDLNLRYARMESYYETLSRNLNDLQARLVALQL
jgi:hypothetical protein